MPLMSEGTGFVDFLSIQKASLPGLRTVNGFAVTLPRLLQT